MPAFRPGLRMWRDSFIPAGPQRDFRTQPKVQILVLTVEFWKPKVSKPEMWWSLYLEGLSVQPKSMLPARKLSACLQKQPYHLRLAQAEVAITTHRARSAGRVEPLPTNTQVHMPNAQTHLGRTWLSAAAIGSQGQERPSGPAAACLWSPPGSLPKPY